MTGTELESGKWIKKTPNFLLLLILFLPLHLFQQVVCVSPVGMLFYFSEDLGFLMNFIHHFFGFNFSPRVIEMFKQEADKI